MGHCYSRLANPACYPLFDGDVLLREQEIIGTPVIRLVNPDRHHQLCDSVHTRGVVGDLPILDYGQIVAGLLPPIKIC